MGIGDADGSQAKLFYWLPFNEKNIKNQKGQHLQRIPSASETPENEHIISEPILTHCVEHFFIKIEWLDNALVRSNSVLLYYNLQTMACTVYN